VCIACSAVKIRLFIHGVAAPVHKIPCRRGQRLAC